MRKIRNERIRTNDLFIPRCTTYLIPYSYNSKTRGENQITDNGFGFYSKKKKTYKETYKEIDLELS